MVLQGTSRLRLSVSREKLNNLITECKRRLSYPLTTLRNLSHVIGLITSVTLAVLPASLHYRKLQFQENEALACHHSYESSIQLNQESLEDLLWWCGHLKRWNGRPIHPTTPRMIVETDASNMGWGPKLPTYYSWKPDPGASAVDALAQDWSNTKGYAFPPLLSDLADPPFLLLIFLWMGCKSGNTP